MYHFKTKHNSPFPISCERNDARYLEKPGYRIEQGAQTTKQSGAACAKPPTEITEGPMFFCHKTIQVLRCYSYTIPSH